MSRKFGYVTSTQEISQMRDPSRAWRRAQGTMPGAPGRARRRREKQPGEHPEDCLCRMCADPQDDDG